MHLRLQPFGVEDEPAARSAHDELVADDFLFLLDHHEGEPWSEYIDRLARRRRGLELPADRVPGAFLGAFLDGQLAGRVSIRFVLNEFLLNVGGHVGYGVRPAFRRRGIATEILRQSLVIARAEGVGRVLVTCDEGNVASARVIERCGGVLEDVRPDPPGPAKRRYWID